MKNDASIKQETSADTPVLYVGIDVSKDTLAIDAGEHYAGTIANTRGAIRRVVGQIRRHAGRGATLRFALEETGPYSLPLRFALDALGQQSCLLDPCKVRHYALAMGIASKSDPIDARVIRQCAEANRSEPTALPPKALLQLRELVRARALLVKVREMVSNLLRISTNALCRSVLREVVVLLDRRVEKLGELQVGAARDCLCEAFEHLVKMRVGGVPLGQVALLRAFRADVEGVGLAVDDLLYVNGGGIRLAYLA